MLLVQKYLLSYASREEALSDLANNYHITIKEYSDDIVMLNYNQIDSPRFDPLVDDCRGLILSYDFSKVFCRPYTRFYNFGEGGDKTRNFDFSKSFVYEKIDGTLACVWYHAFKKIWCISTRKMGYAEGKTVHGNTYCQLFLQGIGLNKKTTMQEFSDIFENEFLDNFLDKKLFHETTFIFELVSKETRVVKRYDKTEVYLTGIRLNNEEKKQSYINIEPNLFKFKKLNVKFPKKYNMNNINELESSFNKLEPTDEGYVCFNIQNEERVKVKNPRYVAIHHLKNNGIISPKRIVELITSGEYNEYISYFPEEKETFKTYFDAYDNLINDITNTYDRIKFIEREKEFALEAKKYIFSDVLFKLKRGKKSIKEIIENMSDDRKVKLIFKYISN